jgi:hypothetical protein
MKCNTYLKYDILVHLCMYRVIINDCPIAVGVENPHKFWMCRSLATLAKLVNLISTTARSATYRRY